MSTDPTNSNKIKVNTYNRVHSCTVSGELKKIIDQFIYTSAKIVTISAKTLLVCTNMCLEKQNLKIIRNIRHATKKNMQVFIRPLLKERRLIHLLMESSNIFCFVPVAPTVCVSRVCNDAGNVNKIVIISSTKPPSYPYAHVTTGLALYLG